MKKLTSANTQLERHVQNWLNSRASDYGDGVQGVLHDLMQGGCQSGYVGHLIYYHDTLKFFATHRREISQMLTEAIQRCGHGPKDVFGDKWDESDPLAQETLNRNLLAWFGFEETARKLANLNNIEI